MSTQCRTGHAQKNLSGSGQDIEGQFCCTKISAKKVTEFTKKKLNPQGKFLQNWNAILLASCVYAIAVDPLFFFVLVINEDKKCLVFHNTLYFIAIALRLVADLISLADISLEFFTSYIDKDKAKRGETTVVGDTWHIAKRYLRSYFLIDVLAILPLPQVLLRIFIFREMRRSKYSDRRNIFNALVCLQYVPRALRIYRSWKKLVTSKKLAKNVRFRSVLNLILYILASQVLGAFWYFFAVNQEMACWQIACENHIGCIQSSFSCDSSLRNYTFINDYCPIHETQNTISYDFGIFQEAIQLGILATSNVPQKLVHCFWWGLRNLSSFGQNLQTSARFLETLFALSISISGLLLFLYFIGNLQMYMQMEKSVRLEKQFNIDVSEFKRKTRSWMSRHAGQYKFPRELKENIDACLSKIEKTQKAFNMENTLPIDWLQTDTRETVKAHLCLPLLKKVPMLKNNDTLLKLILKRLRPVYYKEGSYIFREGEPIDRIVFITSGIALKLIRRTINGEGSGTVLKSCIHEDHGDLVEVNEILNWGVKILEDSSPLGLSNLPISTITLKTHTEVDGFVLRASELMEELRKAPSNTEKADVDSTPGKVQIDHRQPGQGGSTSTTLASYEGLCMKCFPAILNGKAKNRE